MMSQADSPPDARRGMKGLQPKGKGKACVCLWKAHEHGVAHAFRATAKEFAGVDRPAGLSAVVLS